MTLSPEQTARIDAILAAVPTGPDRPDDVADQALDAICEVVREGV